uniref:amidase n=1 Tax=Rhodococcus sp. BH2-N1 TaxID=259061 RepID=Q705U3_9NOCA|nr:amide hydrolase [Rhodococcus sp. BH2-N1]
MSQSEIVWASASELAARVRERSLTPVEIGDAMIEHIDAVNPSINAVVQFDREQVQRDARSLNAQVEKGQVLGPLHGVPFTIKDMTPVAGLPTTFGMRPMRDNMASADAVVVKRLRAAGGLFLGKTNTPESGYYGGTDNHLYGPTHNPWKHDHTAGGSSGGAAAAVAAGIGPIAEGSDGAGSVRIPSAMCGVVGLKPTTGVIPQTLLAGRYYDWVYHGPITRTVADNALMLDVLAGPDPADPLSTDRTINSYVASLDGDDDGLRVAYSPDLGLEHIDPEVASVCRDALTVFDDIGAHVVEATPAWGKPSVSMWHALWVPGFASEHDLCDWPSLRGEVDDNFIELMKEGESLTAVDVGRAEVFRGQMWDTWTTFMNDYDVLVSPTLASAAFPLSQFAPSWLDGKSLREQILDWLLTYPFNMLNNPAITIPAGFTSDGRPVGLQIAARHRRDDLLLRIASKFETRRPWSHRRPS